MNYPSSATQQDTTRLPEDMKVLVNHIYEFKKGVRRMVLFTFNKRYEQFAVTRLQHQNISYVIQPVGNDRLNLFFGKKECLDAIRLMITKPLCQLTPEEDFILGAMLSAKIAASVRMRDSSMVADCSTSIILVSSRWR